MTTHTSTATTKPLGGADPAQLQGRAQALRLLGLLAHWDAVQGDPARLGWTRDLLDWEENERARRSLERRLRSAHIGRFKPLADFDWDWPTHCDRAAVQELMMWPPGRICRDLAGVNVRILRSPSSSKHRL